MGGMTDVDLVGLRTFVIVCETQSLTKAARLLGMTQSAVSQRLKRLEDQSRFKLIDRRLRPVGPTLAGQALLERARRILAEVDRLEFDLSRRADLPIPELRLGIADSLGSALVPPLVQRIRPSVSQLAIRVDASIDLTRLLLQRDLHAVVSSDPLQERDDLERHELYREPLVLVLPPGPEGEDWSGRAALERLVRSLPFIRYSPVSPLARQIEIYLRRSGFEPPRNLEFNESETMVETVRHGLGWAITTPLCLLQAGIGPGEVRVVRLPCGGMSRSFSFLCRKQELGPLSHQLVQASCAIIEARVVRRIAREWPWLHSSVTVATGEAQHAPTGIGLKGRASA